VDLPLDSHPASTDRTCGLMSPCIPPVERHRPASSQPIAAVPASKHSPTHKRTSETAAVALPTPVSPPARRRTKPDSIPITPPSPLGPHYSRSQSATNSPAAHLPGSHPGSTKSSIKRVPVPIVDQDLAGAASGTRSTSASSGKSTPTHEPATSKPREPRTRNVLRKRSIAGTNRRHEAESAPTSDSEKKPKLHRPRAQSVVFSSSSRRDSMSPVPDISQPLPGTTVPDLTPAKEILVAYKKSHRDSFSRDKSLRSSGRVVAVGSEEDLSAGSHRNPWSSGWKSGRKDERSADERDTAEKRETGARGLRRKFSGKWGSREPDRPYEPKRSISENAPGVSERGQARDIEAKRSVTLPVDTRVSASPTSGRSPRQESQHDAVEGRVWEEYVGDWVGKYIHDTEMEEKEVSNSRRLWRLVKRLSVGHLREKVIPPVDVPPPVPPLPKDLAQRQQGTRPGDADGPQAGEMPIQHSAVPETSGGIMRFISSVPPLSIPRSNSVSGLGARRPGAHHRSEGDSGANPLSPVASRTNALHRSVTTGTTPQMRRSATTRSSSPSSETTKFFSRSRTSSSSSYGDAAVPPIPSMPPARVGKHAVSPREHHSGQAEKGKDKATVERPSSRPTSSPSSASTSRESPIVPFFEARNVINKFLPYKGRRATVSSPTTTHFPDHEQIEPRTEQARGTIPPPIPQRNPRRPGHHSVSIPVLPLPVQQHAVPNVIPVQDSSESEAMEEDTTHPKQRLDSGQTPSVVKARPRSISDGAIILEPERHANTAKSILTFREMTTTQRQLTEQEKNAKWEDLLQRSDKAGGTLHVGSPTMGGLGLWSDRSSVALSETSEMPPN
jgi:hypothetical protein